MEIKYINLQRDNTNIRCKVYYPNDKKIESLVIFGHGFGGHKESKAAERLAEKLISKNKGFGLLSFDLPCHGDDVKKKLSLADCMWYYEVVIHDAPVILKAQKLYMNATSFGAFLTLKYISENPNPFEKIVLRSSAIDMYKTMSDALITDEIQEKLNKKKEAEVGFDRKIIITSQFLDELAGVRLLETDFMDYADDIFIIHGTKDEIASFEDAKRFSENNVIDFEAVEGADHRFKDLKKLEYANVRTLDFFGV